MSSWHPSGSPPEFPDAGAAFDYKRLFDLSLDLVCIAGLDGYFRRVNASWTRVLGWTESELLARPVEAFMHPDDRERTLNARAALARGIPVRGLENRYLCKDGGFRWLAWQSSVELDTGRVYAVARDITQRRLRDHELLISGKLESTRVLAGGIAHDFNNLLAVLALSLDMVETSGPLNTAQLSFIKHAKESMQSARTLTHQLLAVSDAVVSPLQDVDLSALLPDACDLALQGGTVSAEYRFPARLWPVKADALQISSAFSGFVMNAREAAPRSGKVCVQAENVTIGRDEARGRQPGDYVRIRVTDDGVGMPADVLARVFDPYFSTKERGSRKGMGLGLTICRRVIQKHGGTVDIESEPGRGTTVICHLPAATMTTE